MLVKSHQHHSGRRARPQAGMSSAALQLRVGRDSAKLGCRVLRRHQSVICKRPGLLPPPSLRSRNRGLAWKAHRVISGDVLSSCGRNIFNKCLNKFGYVTCTADTTLNVHRESEIRISTHVDDGCAVGQPPASNRVLSAIETMLTIKRSGPFAPLATSVFPLRHLSSVGSPSPRPCSPCTACTR